MKRTISTLIIMFITIAIVSFGFILNTNATFSLSESLSQAEKLCSDGNRSKAENMLDNSIYEWENRSKKIMLFYNHDKIDQVDESLHVAKIYAKTKQPEMFSAECNRTVIMLRHMHELELPTLYNIF